MPRQIRSFDPTWKDRAFRKTFEKLSAAERTRQADEITALIELLGRARHPTLDPALQSWRPSAYRVPGVAGLFEYRGRNLLRIIAQWREPTAEEPEGLVLLIAITLDHDHDRLRRLIESNRRDLD